MNVALDVDALEAAAVGGRVAHSPFLDEAESAAWSARLRERGVAVSAWGGMPAAARRVVTARPPHVPEATAPLSALYLPGLVEPDEARVALLALGADEDRLGDARRFQDGVGLVVWGDPPAAWLAPSSSTGSPVAAEQVSLDRMPAGTVRRLQAVVPSLRADVLGAKAFGASRSWFVKGVATGKVRVDGRPAGKSTTVERDGEMWAEGLGRMRLLEVVGETKRGNLKVVVEIERP